MPTIVKTELNDLLSRLTHQQLKNEQLINENYLLKKALLNSRNEHSDLNDYNSSAYLTIDQNYYIKTINFQANLPGFKIEKLINQSFLKYITPESQSILQEKIQILMDSKCKQICEIKVSLDGNEYKYIKLQCILLQNQMIRLNLVDTTNIHYLENHNLELQTSFNLINNLFQGASDALAAVDKDFNISILNELFSELFSRITSSEVISGTNLITNLEHFPDLKSKITQACHKALEEEKTEILIENSLKNINTYYCYKLRIHTIYNQGTHEQAWIFRIIDLTDFKLAERMQHKQQSEIALSCRTSAMGEMASALAHEINQPLTAIAAYSQGCLFLIKNDLTNTLNNKLLHPLTKIASQAELAGEIIHNMKNFIREGHLNAEKTNINALIRDTISIFNYELLDYKLKITLNLMDDLPNIMANKIHIMQVILNLARNSVEALKSSATANPELTIESFENDDHIHIHVIDNGPGIPYELRNRILNTYFTTKRKGTGIGLGICRTLIEGHKGKLTLHQHDNRGAWFIFTLPLNPDDIDD